MAEETTWTTDAFLDEQLHVTLEQHSVQLRCSYQSYCSVLLPIR